MVVSLHPVTVEVPPLLVVMVKDEVSVGLEVEKNGSSEVIVEVTQMVEEVV